MAITCIRGSRVIDPAAKETSFVSEVRDLWWRDGLIIEPPADPHSESVEYIDADECITMAGGIDLHTHIGGGKLTLARLLMRDQMPPWRVGLPKTSNDPGDSQFLPSAAVTARRYLEMGYTTCFEPAVIPCNARAAHAEMADVRRIDCGGYCLLGNDDVLLQLISENADQAIINAYVAYMVTATRSIAVKVVNPGGISAFKFNQRTFDVDTPHPHYNVTPGKIIRTLCRAVNEIGLAHPLHVHCSNLGVPGNIDSTLATIDAADGYPVHLTHAQFHVYGTEGPYQFSSASERLIEAMQTSPGVTIDIGQIQFGRTVTVSADAMHQFENRMFAKPRKSIILDIECEAGCGVVPFRYARREFVHSLQWAIGLELLLLCPDPSRVFLTTDHPNGAPFTAYPHLIRLLMDRSFRETALAEIHPDAAAASSLAGIEREYTLEEIAIMTRSAPAEILGLSDRGRLQPGCRADVVIYRQHPDQEQMFRSPRMVVKAGQVVCRDGQWIESLESEPTDQTLAATPHVDESLIADFRHRYAGNAMMDLNRLWISPDEMRDTLGSQLVPMGMKP